MRFASHCALAGVVLVTATSAISADAATLPARQELVIADPVGDTIAPALNGDIVMVSLTTGVARYGKHSFPYGIRKFVVVRMDLSEPVSASGRTSYEVDAMVSKCGLIRLYTTPGAVFNNVHGTPYCGGMSKDNSDYPDPAGLRSGYVLYLTPDVVVKGKTITFTFDYAENPAVLRTGGRINNVHAFTAIVEPLLGEAGPATVPYYDPGMHRSTFYIDEVSSAKSLRPE